MDKQLMGIRISAVHLALEKNTKFEKLMPALIHTILEDAKEIEKYILGYETKPEQE